MEYKMRYMKFHLMYLLWSFISCNTINPDFIRDYYQHRGVNQIVFISCLESFDTMDLLKKLMKSELQISYLPETHDDVDLRRVLQVRYYKLGIFLDLDCSNTENFVQKFLRNSIYYNESYFWLMQTRNDIIPSEIIQPLQLSINCEITVALQKEINTYTLFDVYNPSYRHGGLLNITHMGEWTPENGLINKLTEYKYKRRGDLHGLRLNFSVSFAHLPTTADVETYLTTPVNKHIDTMHRYSYALSLYLKDHYNFTINLQRAATWGYKVNGSYNGILGDMILGLVDVAVSPFRLRKDRLDIVDYTVQVWIAGPKILFRHPDKNELSNQFFKPFKYEIWITTMVVAISIWYLLYLTAKVEHHYCYGEKEQNSTLHTIPASETALITTAAICQQGLSDGPRFYSGRIIFISLFLCTLLLYQFYSASIVGSLVAARPRFITTPKAILESSLAMGAEDIAYLYDFFNTQQDPVIAALNKKKLMPNKYRKKPSYFTAEEGLKKVQKGGFAFLIDVATAYKIIEDSFTDNEICSLQGVDVIPPVHTAIAVAKHSPFKKMVTYGLRKIVERGMTNRLRQVWHPRRPQCPESHSSLPTPVALQEFSPALFMLIVGIFISILVMLTENMIQKYWYNLYFGKNKIICPSFCSTKIDTEDSISY